MELEFYTTGTGQRLKVHAASECTARDSLHLCVIHNPAPGPWSGWRTHWREDVRVMERLCPHGVGHPAVENGIRQRAHGCDGCPCSYKVIEGEVVQ